MPDTPSLSKLKIRGEFIIPLHTLTDKVVPLGVEVGLVGEAALHHVEAQRVAGPQHGHTPAQRAVPLPHQGAHALRTSAQLEKTHKDLDKNKEAGVGGRGWVGRRQTDDVINSGDDGWRRIYVTLMALLTMSRPVAKPWDSALAAMNALDT